MPTTARSLLLHADEFLRAADAVVAHSPRDRMPIYYLLGHALELALKSFLLAEGVSLTDLKRRYGHDLVKLDADARSLGLGNAVPITPLDIGLIKVMNIDYLAKRFEYMEHGTVYHVPEKRYLRNTLAKFMRGIDRHLQQKHGA